MTGAIAMTQDSETRLIAILEREVAIYDRLLEAKAAEKEALIAFDTPDLENCTRSQEILVSEATQLEFTRRKLVRGLAEQNGYEGTDPTLREVVDWVSDSSAQRIEELGDLLRHAFTEIARLQDANAILIEGATTYIHKTVDTLISRSKEDPFAYGKSGAKATLRETVPGLLDRKA